MMNEIEALMEDIKQRHISADRLPQFIEVEGITQSQVVIDGKEQNSPCTWGIVEQEAKWIFFEMDDERGYIWYSKDFNTIKEACDFAKEYFEPRLRVFDAQMKQTAMVEEFEQTIQAILPGDYSDFLIKSIGDYRAFEDVSLTVSGVDEPIGIDTLFGFSAKRSLNLMEWYREYRDELPEKAIIIGDSCGAGLIVLTWQEDWRGVFLWDNALVLESSTEEDCLYRIADSFKEFQKMLRKRRKK